MTTLTYLVLLLASAFGFVSFSHHAGLFASGLPAFDGRNGQQRPQDTGQISLTSETTRKGENPPHRDAVSQNLYDELDELARLVDITYCVGTSGIVKPFQCASRCSEFAGFELIKTWETGRLMSDSCGYIVLSHPPSPPRIIIAFRGTYSLANTIADLSTIPQDYTPYDPDGNTTSSTWSEDDCKNCTVHSGFLKSWHHTRPEILSTIEKLSRVFPDYELTLVGHSLGGAIAALASLDFIRMGWTPHVTTFGEPRVGNQAFAEYVNGHFSKRLSNGWNPLSLLNGKMPTFRRVTHVDDPVPLLPPTEWNYEPHGNEIYISSTDLPPKIEDVWICKGSADEACITATEAILNSGSGSPASPVDAQGLIPSRFKLWQLFFAHRDYFQRLGLCIPGNDPSRLTESLWE